MEMSVASRSRGFDVIKGPVALAEGKYWRGWATGNQSCKKRRRTSERAIQDAQKLEDKIQNGK